MSAKLSSVLRMFSLSTDHLKIVPEMEIRIMDEMELLVKIIAQNLVDQPGEVSVSKVEGDNTIVLELSVGKGDVGKVIGKQGRTAEAIRTLLSAVSSKQRKRAILEIIE
jgi:predicted RNA-binding protein YlqC (UPF0109 family)